MSRRLGDDPLTRKRGNADGTVMVEAAASTGSSSHNRVFFQRRLDGIDQETFLEPVDAVPSGPVAIGPEPAAIVTSPSDAVVQTETGAPTESSAATEEPAVEASSSEAPAPEPQILEPVPAGPEAPAPAVPEPPMELSWTAQLVQRIAAPVVTPAPDATTPAPEPAPAAETAAQGETQQGSGFFKKFFGREE